MAYTYEYPRPALTVDCILFGLDLEDEALRVLLIQRALEPHKGSWALPGGFVQMDETIDDAALRELREETGVSRVFLEQLYTFGAIDRDPRERTVSVAYYALVKWTEHPVRAATDASSAAWFGIHDTPKLAFDHEEILKVAIERLRGKVRCQPIGFEVLPQKFTLTQLQTLYEIVLERDLDQRNFRKRILAMDILEELDEVEQDVFHRAARLYQFDQRKYRRRVKEGFDFQV